ncbi:MAG: MFS transporter, partial [Gemmobacter sp.]|nr:MFS transporter [Gemmobacter sp.]
TVVRDMVPDAQAASMIGYVTMGMALVPMVGPIIGGAIDEAFGWRANFVLLFILGAIVTAICWADLGETARPSKTTLMGQVRQYPVLFKSYRFWGYAITAAAASGAFFSFLGGAPFVGSEVYGMSPATLGYYFAAPAVGYLIGNFASARLSVRMGIVRMVLAGGLVLSIAMSVLLVLTLMGIRHQMLFFGMMTAVGIGNGLTMPNANAGMMSVRPDLAGTASGLGGAIMVAGGAALAALAGAVLQPGGTELPLVAIMFVTSLIALGATVVVIRRNRLLGL